MLIFGLYKLFSKNLQYAVKHLLEKEVSQEVDIINTKYFSPVS